MASRIKYIFNPKRWWRFVRPVRHVASFVRVEKMSEVPEQLGGVLYIVGAPTAKWVLLDCPCGCGDRIDVNLMTSRKPSWRVTTKQKMVSLYPSIWVPKERCGSHFWIEESRIMWV